MVFPPLPPLAEGTVLTQVYVIEVVGVLTRTKGIGDGPEGVGSDVPNISTVGITRVAGLGKATNTTPGWVANVSALGVPAVSIASGRFATIATVRRATDVLHATRGGVEDRATIGISRVTAESNTSEAKAIGAATVGIAGGGLATVAAVGYIKRCS